MPYHGKYPELPKPIIDRAMNGSGLSDIMRVFEISPTTIIEHFPSGKFIIGDYYI